MPISRLERRTVALTMLAAAVVQANAAFRGGLVGQDWILHYNPIVAVAGDPSRTWDLILTNPPLFYGFYGAILRLAGESAFQPVAGLINVAINLGALWLYWMLLRHSIADARLRMSAFVLVALIPVRLIHTLVLAADALTVLPVLAAVWFLWRLDSASTFRDRAVWGVAIGAVLLPASLIKYTFLSAIPATLLAVIQIARRRGWPVQHAIALLAVTVLPLTVSIAAQRRGYTALGGSARYRLAPTGVMSLRSLVAPKAVDTRLLSAPSVWIRPDVPTPGESHELLMRDKYSYPALLHLGLYTDLKNIFQPKRPGEWFGRQRTPFVQKAMSLSAKTALPLSILVAITGAMAVVFYVFVGLWQPSRTEVIPEALLLYGSAWWAALLVSFPFIPEVYRHGYWVPRLILPAVFAYSFLAFYVLDRWRKRPRWVAPALLGYVCLQSAIHLSFLWMR
jgi:hypothetical protein